MRSNGRWNGRASRGRRGGRRARSVIVLPLFRARAGRALAKRRGRCRWACGIFSRGRCIMVAGISSRPSWSRCGCSNVFLWITLYAPQISKISNSRHCDEKQHSPALWNREAAEVSQVFSSMPHVLRYPTLHLIQQMQWQHRVLSCDAQMALKRRQRLCCCQFVAGDLLRLSLVFPKQSRWKAYAQRPT